MTLIAKMLSLIGSHLKTIQSLVTMSAKFSSSQIVFFLGVLLFALGMVFLVGCSTKDPAYDLGLKAIVRSPDVVVTPAPKPTAKPEVQEEVIPPAQQ